MPKKLLILGGYGNAGLPIARLLIQETTLHLILAGRSLEKAKGTAEELNKQYQCKRVSAGFADAASSHSLNALFALVDMVLVASSSTEYADQVVTAALRANIDYFDIQLSSKDKLTVLSRHSHKIKDQNLCFITDGGFHPGVPAAMVKYANQKFDRMPSAVVSAAFQLDWSHLNFSESTISEFAEEIAHYNSSVFTGGKWVKSSKYPNFEFGPWFGKKYGAPMMMEELYTVPDEIPSLKETGFYIAGFNWMTDYIVLPIVMIGTKLFGTKLKRPLGRLFGWSLRRYSKPPFGAVLQINATGIYDNRPSSFHMRLTHQDPYLLTAIPAVACILQYLNGPKKTGVHFQGRFVEPNQFFADVKRLGITVTEKSEWVEQKAQYAN